MKIIGAGITGCIAGLIFPEAEIHEASSECPINHGAVLRFRDESVSHATGIPFRKVCVKKGIYMDGIFIQPSIQIANMYSRKVLRHIADRSIWNIETATRFIAPKNFQERLIGKVKGRIILSSRLEHLAHERMISTIPMKATLDHYNIKTDADFVHQKIYTKRMTVNDSDVFQTVYYPGELSGVYRASITGNELIIESVWPISTCDIEMVAKSFWIVDLIDESNHKELTQNYGKIKNIDEAERKSLLFKLTHEYGVYSAGRYAIWKNVLTDDVLNDLYVIKKMIETNPYDRKKLEI